MNTLICAECGIAFGVPSEWEQARRKDNRDFYCPNQHRLSFRTSLVDKLRAEKEQAERHLQSRLNEESHARLVAEKALAKERRARHKLELRVSKGVCPCCNRTFLDLQRHMVTKHKDFGLPAGATPKLIEGTVQ